MVRPDGSTQLRWIQAGSASLYVGHPPEAHFGLADDDTVDLRITWPDGECSELSGVDTRQRIVVERR